MSKISFDKKKCHEKWTFWGPKSEFLKFGPKYDFKAQKALVEVFLRDLERKLDVLPHFQQKKQQMLKMLIFFSFWSKFENFQFLAKFEPKPQ